MRASTNVVDVKDDYADSTSNVGGKYKAWALIIAAAWVVYGIYNALFEDSNVWIEVLIMILFAMPSLIEVKAWLDEDNGYSDGNEESHAHEEIEEKDRVHHDGYADRIRNHYKGKNNGDVNIDDDQNAERKHEDNDNKEEGEYKRPGLVSRWIYRLLNVAICVYLFITCVMAFKKNIQEKMSLLSIAVLTVEDMVRMGYSMIAARNGKGWIQLIAFVSMCIVSGVIWVGIAIGLID
ncbi:hypothetical protein HK407_02g03280 [Ordospora pajunii]|uniref:uncharacterized protein n=1 Tax=Ordospora pajunii TaxID=3039483 RepID=UPI0029527498|nr:uncharacterized protein HK407_02g03280 [Ordospora pajunii]KAH9411884.1 hypothetical protein HK407_02g03280 [Ordospora pajunii]